MKKNIVNVIYPDEAVHSFVMETDMSVDNILERVFAEWNHGSGVESEFFVKSKIRSLSVNDIVCVNGKYFQCDSIGWNEVTAEYVNELEEEVENNPLTLAHGPWFGLSEVMYNRKSKKNLELT